MASTVFVDKQTPIISAWLNDVNNAVYGGLGVGGVAPQTPDTIRTNLSLARVVTSISALRLLLKTGSPEAFVTGYYAQGDGGGGAYYYDSTDVVSADNGGSIIVAADGGRWKLAQTSGFNVKQFGAKGDAATDDTVAFQNASAATTPGGTVWVSPGEYKITATIRCTGVMFQGTCAIGVGTFEATEIDHKFNGNLFEFYRGGGGLRGLMIDNWDVSGTPYTGAAVYGLADGVNQAPGRVYIEDCVFTSSFGWERCVDVDGTLSANGCRQWFFTHCLFFGATTAGQTIRIKKGVNWFFNGCEIIPAPTVVTQGIRIENSFSTDIYYYGKIEGNIYTEAAGALNLNQVGFMFDGDLTGGTITCAAGSARNYFDGFVEQNVMVNSGDITNRKRSELYHLVGAGGEPAFLNGWVNFGSGNAPARFRKDGNNMVYLSGLVSTGTINTPIFTLPALYRPTTSVRFPAASNALFGMCVVDTAGNVTPVVGSNVNFSLDGIVFMAEA